MWMFKISKLITFVILVIFLMKFIVNFNPYVNIKILKVTENLIIFSNRIVILILYGYSKLIKIIHL